MGNGLIMQINIPQAINIFYIITISYYGEKGLFKTSPLVWEEALGKIFVQETLAVVCVVLLTLLVLYWAPQWF